MIFYVFFKMNFETKKMGQNDGTKMKHIETHIKMMEKNKAKSAFDIFSAKLAEAVSCLESNWWSPQTLIRFYFGGTLRTPKSKVVGISW